MKKIVNYNEKRICFIVYNISQYGGAEQVACNLAKEFAKSNCVYIVSIINDELPPAYEYSCSGIASLVKGEYHLRKLQIKAFKPLRSFLQENEIDIAFIIGYYAGFITLPMRAFTRTKLVFCDHGALINQWDDKKARLIRKMSSKICHHTVVLTEQTKEDYIDKFGVNKKRIDCIYNWIEPSEVDSQKYDINSKRVLSAGRLTSEKGFDRLIAIMAPILKRHEDWHLDIAGDGNMFEELERIIDREEIGDNIHLIGRVDDLRAKYKKYAMYVLPSYREGLPLVLLEAQINKLPIIAFDIMTGPREIIKDGVDGFLIADNDYTDMREKVNMLMENRDERIRLSNNSSINIECFSKEKVMQQWSSLMNEISKK